MFKKLRKAKLPNVLHSKIRILKITITIPGEHETKDSEFKKITLQIYKLLQA